jgi:hypothetical protein
VYDVYLGGVTTSEWRKEFKSQISSDISVFDPYIESFSEYNKRDKAEQIAREFYFMDECDIIVFYFNSKASKSARLQLGDAVGNNKQTIVCIDGKVPGKTFIKRYCEFRGVILVESIEDLISTVEECASELELCQFEFDEDDE